MQTDQGSDVKKEKPTKKPKIMIAAPKCNSNKV